MELQLEDVALFTRIAELGTLSAAARERDIPVSQVTRALARLEGCCGVRLLHRSTHGLSLTDEGDTFLLHARALLETRDVLASELGRKREGPSGWVRLSASPAIAELLIAPSLPGLYARHPQLHLDINADDRVVDMAREGIDIAIRSGSPNSDLLIAREIGHFRRALYAAPSYLAQHGVPQHPDDLAQHRLIGFTVMPQLNLWPVLDASGQAMTAQGHTRTDNSATVLALIRHGVGIGRLVDRIAQPLVDRGELQAVLPQHTTSPSVPLFAVILKERHRLPKIRACIDYWAQWWQDSGHLSPP